MTAAVQGVTSGRMSHLASRADIRRSWFCIRNDRKEVRQDVGISDMALNAGNVSGKFRKEGASYVPNCNNCVRKAGVLS